MLLILWANQLYCRVVEPVFDFKTKHCSPHRQTLAGCHFRRRRGSRSPVDQRTRFLFLSIPRHKWPGKRVCSLESYWAFVALKTVKVGSKAMDSYRLLLPFHGDGCFRLCLVSTEITFFNERS
ncbi:hypothetical protein OIU77_029127 [Salix suchowensis]|uniref:Uncharacterized protein n=1 Tax=Salix suchowensis TaxID=1278906 RepID=A0ABQ9BMH1_9ROSI|nr:hypothetical protein OIU77_029127 [Salix suchowensis]